MKRSFVPVLYFSLAAISSLALSAEPPSAASPLSPAESLKHFDVAAGLRLELAAAEPHVIDPVAVRFDEQGRMWVVEMRDYPNGPAEGEPPLSVIRLLEDLDGDGYFEHSRVFADKLLFATGLQPWRGGVIVTLAGSVVYMKDQDGDGAVDLQQEWYRGFAEDNPQLRANHPRLGLDNQVYVANGLRGGMVVDARLADAKPLSISGMDFRFDPFSMEYSAVSGVGQFGLTFDEQGNRFVCSNRNPFKQIILENKYLEQARGVAVAAVSHDVAQFGEQSKIYPISRAWTTSTLHAGQFTAACGLLVYRGTGLPGSLHGAGLTCDPTGSLVHAEQLVDRGVTFRGQPLYPEDEVLRSTDEWFRPVNLELGPDGGLYIVDIHRAVIEHPNWVPAELKDRLDNRYGDDRGRIYRLVADTWKRPTRHQQLDQLNTARLAGMLSHPNAWQRDTAARLLLEQADPETADLLKRVFERDASPLASMHALWLLHSQGQLQQDQLVAGLGNKDAMVRRQSLRLAELYREQWPQLATAMLKRANDDDIRVRFQFLLSTTFESPQPVQPIVQIAIRDAGDEWVRQAVRMAAGSRAGEVLVGVLSAPLPGLEAPRQIRMELVAELASASGRILPADQLADVLAALLKIDSHDVQWRGIDALLRASRARRIALDQLAALLSAADKMSLQESLLASHKVLRKGSTTATPFMVCLRLLAFTAAPDAEILDRVLEQPQAETRTELIRSLAMRPEDTSWPMLIERFGRETPRVRREILDGLLANSARTRLLLAAIESNEIKPTEIDAIRTRRLVDHGNKEIQQQARTLLARSVPGDRQAVLAAYQPVLKLTGQPGQGELVFRKNCATCHRVGSIGVNVAPDIADSRTRQPVQLLTDILQPNRAIDSNYVSYSVVTTDGRIVEGILATESTVSITLKQPEGKTVTLLRTEIDQLRSNGKSLMPVGLEKNINQQQMADLISFIKNWRYLDGKTPLARPLPDDDK